MSTLNRLPDGRRRWPAVVVKGTDDTAPYIDTAGLWAMKTGLCGNTRGPYEKFPSHGLMAAKDTDDYKDWTFGNTLVEADPGDYDMCWCAKKDSLNSEHNCDPGIGGMLRTRSSMFVSVFHSVPGGGIGRPRIGFSGFESPGLCLWRAPVSYTHLTLPTKA